MAFSGAQERKALRRQTAELLAALGRTSTEVASSLASYQARGRPQDPQGCAVAVYLGAVLGADPRVHTVKVSRALVRVTLAGRRRWVDVPSPPAVRCFIQLFDQGLFPSLVGAGVSDGAMGLEAGVGEQEASVLTLA